MRQNNLSIVGLYLDPPENALVISVDEKTTIQVLDRPFPSKPMKPGVPEKVEAHYIKARNKVINSWVDSS